MLKEIETDQGRESQKPEKTSKQSKVNIDVDEDNPPKITSKQLNTLRIGLGIAPDEYFGATLIEKDPPLTDNPREIGVQHS